MTTVLALTAELELHTQRSLQQAANQENFDTDTAFERDCPFRSFPHFFHQTPDSTIPCSPPLLISHSAKLDLEALAEQLTHSLKGHTPATSASAISASLALGFAFYALADFERARPLLETAHHVPDPPSSHLGDLLVASYVLRGGSSF